MRSPGDLEREVMNRLWDADVPLSVRDVLGLIDAHGLAYTTVMTVLDRLRRKDLVKRIRQGRAFLYSPTHGRDALTSELMNTALDSAGKDRTAALVHFTESVSAQEAAAMREALERIAARDQHPA